MTDGKRCQHCGKPMILVYPPDAKDACEDYAKRSGRKHLCKSGEHALICARCDRT